MIILYCAERELTICHGKVVVHGYGIVVKRKIALKNLLVLHICISYK
jgi:hypothetical protein